MATQLDNMTSHSMDSLAVRDLSQSFDILLKQSPSWMKYLKIFPSAKNTKHEWIQSQLGASVFTVGTVTNQTTLILDSINGLKEGTIVRFENKDGKSKVGKGKITAINKDTKTITIAKTGANDIATIAATDVIKVLSTPQEQNAKADPEAGYKPETEYNYTQIFAKSCELSNTLQAIEIYGGYNNLDVQMIEKMRLLTQELGDTCLWGEGHDGKDGKPTQMRGLEALMSGGNVVAAGGVDMSKDILNNAIAMIASQGGGSSNLLFLCHPNQVRKFSALNATGTNPTQLLPVNGTTVGSYAEYFISDLAGVEGLGLGARICAYQNFPTDELWVLDMDNIGLSYLEGRTPYSQDATLPGQDGKSEVVRFECTLVAYNAQKRNCIIKNLK